jgi:hypothetical protein
VIGIFYFREGEKNEAETTKQRVFVYYARLSIHGFGKEMQREIQLVHRLQQVVQMKGNLIQGVGNLMQREIQVVQSVVT